VNKERRKSLSNLADQMRSAFDTIEELRSAIETIRDEEQEYFDNMPESLQSGEKGAAAENAVSMMEDAMSNLEQAIEAMENAAASTESSTE
jgi:flagellar biosynthesis chaperone FliJ